MANPKSGDGDDFFGDFKHEQGHNESPNPNCADMNDQNPREVMATHESRAAEEQFRNIGYLEAFEKAKEIRLQEGFEVGYRSTFPVSMRIGEVLGRASAVALLGINSGVDQQALSAELHQMSRKIVMRLTQVEGKIGDGIENNDTLQRLSHLEIELLENKRE